MRNKRKNSLWDYIIGIVWINDNAFFFWRKKIILLILTKIGSHEREEGINSDTIKTAQTLRIDKLQPIFWPHQFLILMSAESIQLLHSRLKSLR
jgi:hypothetical protein